MTRIFPAAFTLALLLAAAVGAGQTGDEGTLVEFAGRKARTPAAWAAEKPDIAGVRYQFRLEPVQDDKAPVYVTVSLPEKAEAGLTPAGHVKKWQNWFLPPEGQTLGQASRVRKLEVGGLAAVSLDIRGDYKGIPGVDSTPRPNQRLLGVCVTTPKGPVFLQMFGPNTSVEYYREGFERWLARFRS